MITRRGFLGSLWRSDDPRPWSDAEEDIAAAIRLCEGIADDTIARGPVDFDTSYGAYRLRNAAHQLRREFLKLQISSDRAFYGG